MASKRFTPEQKAEPLHCWSASTDPRFQNLLRRMNLEP